MTSSYISPLLLLLAAVVVFVAVLDAFFSRADDVRVLSLLLLLLPPFFGTQSARRRMRERKNLHSRALFSISLSLSRSTNPASLPACRRRVRPTKNSRRRRR